KKVFDPCAGQVGHQSMNVFDSVYRRMIKAFVFDVMIGQELIDVHDSGGLRCAEVTGYNPQTIKRKAGRW
ncbi:MAG TPA: hypothetical protein DDW42_08665, partial [Desulfobacteraceae bacterium]|nr:hypothetical protein [Desulfobacteraceae bacterium]